MRLISFIFIILFGMLSLMPSFLMAQNSPKHYLIDFEFEDISPPTPQGVTLLVSTPSAISGFDTTRMLFMRTPYVLEYYRDSQWVDTPARMMLPLLVRSLETEQSFAAVIAANISPTLGQFRLDTQVLRLQQEFFEVPSQVRFALRAQLFDMQQRSAVATKVFEVVETAPSEDAEGGVLATNRAVKRLFSQLAAFVANTVQPQGDIE